MTGLLQTGVGNAAAATLLALAAVLVCRFLRGRRPALAHALWLLVLLKLLTPPLWTAGVPWPSSREAVMEVEAPDEVEPPAPGIATSPEPGPEPLAEGDAHEPSPVAATVAAESPLADGPWPHVFLSPSQWVIVVWAAGSILCLLLVVSRSMRFMRLLAQASPAPPDVTGCARRLAARMGVKHAPDVWFVPGAVCPMLWAVAGRARLLLPGGLWDSLPAAQRDTLIAHELAHLRRRDHWVRLIEVAATVLFWWHPVAWWARRELREAEEQCCDAWVVWSMPNCARQYMNAILNAVDYVSDASAPLPMPPVACGMASGEFRQLKRRLVMIRRHEGTRSGPAGPTLGRGGWLALCGGAVALLPLAPSLARQDPPARQVTVVAAPEAENVAENVAVDLRESEAVTVIEPSEDVVVRAIPRASRFELKSADKAYVVDVESEDSLRAPGEYHASFEGADVRFMPAGRQKDHLRYEVERARHDVERLGAELQAAKARLATAEAVAGRSGKSYKPTTVLKKSGDAANASLKLDVKVRPVKEKVGNSDGRLDELERKLDRLLDEVESLKDSREGRGRSTTPPVMLQSR